MHFVDCNAFKAELIYRLLLVRNICTRRRPARHIAMLKCYKVRWAIHSAC